MPSRDPFPSRPPQTPGASREEPITCVSPSAPFTRSLAVVRLRCSFSCGGELSIPPVPLDRARQVDPVLTVPIGEERVESFHVHGKEIGRRCSGRERGQPQRPGAHRGGGSQKGNAVESPGGGGRGNGGGLGSIPGGLKGPFTPSYRVKVPFMRGG